MKQSKEPRVIIIFGPPGSGKGTQGELLEENLNFYHLETSRIIVKKLANAKKGDFVKVQGKKYFLLEEKKLRESGKLMSPPVMGFWVKDKIKELAKEGKGIVTSGAARTLYEAKIVIPLLKRLYGLPSIKVVLIKISDKESIRRNQCRRTCELMRHPILCTEETLRLTKCPLDGSKLVSRRDDSLEVIKVRLKEYKERTLPILDYLRKEGLKIKKVNGEQSVVEVFHDILKAVK
jgi:adenylate kinase